MRVFYSDTFVLPLPPGHRFPMEKYALLRERVLAEGIVSPERLHVPEPASVAELARAHTPAYIERVLQGALSSAEQRRIGFPWSPQMVERSRRSAGATIAACRVALSEGVGVNLAGGTHHAFADAGAGYCVFNDAAVAARAMQAEGRAHRIAIVDCDVHQGDGTPRFWPAIQPSLPSRSMARIISPSVNSRAISTSPCPTLPVMLPISMRWNGACDKPSPLPSPIW